MFKRKIATAAIAAVMALSLAAPVMAADGISSGTNSSDTEVEYNYDVTDYADSTSDFVWTIPAKQTFTKDQLSYNGQNVEIKPAGTATKLLLPAGGTITINVNSANGYKLWTMKDSARIGTSEIDYDVYKDGQAGAAFTSNDQVLQFVSGTSNREGISQGLTFATTADKIAAATASGAHTDQLTFTMAASGI